ncbi:hypothetical protein, partial [Serratia liquefaciens]|uniref:hypothetical protein n=1 Tax=Serratia liquefaciens TaxID=614 RepID=UPI00235E4288
NELDDTNFNGMNRDDAKKMMEGFDQRYAEIFMRMNKYMPPYMRGGRDAIRDWTLLQPVQIASEASTFSTQYTLNQM